MKDKILLVADMEGCCGITDLKNFEDCRDKMILETDFVVSTLKDLGYDCVSVLDCHNDGLTLQEYCKDRGIEFYNHVWSFTDGAEYSAAMLIGFHGKAGCSGILSHTMRPDITDVLLGGKSVGEVTLVCNYLAGLDVPVVYISGDRSIEDELGGYKGVFLATKQCDIPVTDLDANKKAIVASLSETVGKNRSIKCEYCTDKVNIVTAGGNAMRFLPSEVFSTEGNEVVFEDTAEMFGRMPSLCRFLNLSQEYYSLRMELLAELIDPKERAYFERDERAAYILNEKDWQAYSDEDFAYLTDYARRADVKE